MDRSFIIRGIVGEEPNVARLEACSGTDPFGRTLRSWMTATA
ncbi:MAG: hypothetical protein ACXWXB_08845 [Actinomycetota bacterium]